MRQSSGEIEVTPPSKGLHEVTRDIETWLADRAVREGLLTVYIRHTSASLVIQENVDGDVLRDLEDFLIKLAPEDMALYRHVAEGPDDMPAHIRAALTQTHLAIPVCGGRLALGTYQGIFVLEHRTRPRPRTLALHLLGE